MRAALLYYIAQTWTADRYGQAQRAASPAERAEFLAGAGGGARRRCSVSRRCRMMLRKRA
jgi:hypothetical protein